MMKMRYLLGPAFALLAACVLPVSCYRPELPDREPDFEPDVPEHAVDMGIVMTREDGTTYKLYWAESNLSERGLCPNPEDFGDYFAWGETSSYYKRGHATDNPCTQWKSGKDGYDWESYKWCGSIDLHARMIRYCPSDKPEYWAKRGNPDNKSEFMDYGYADDAARAILHGKWRMPSRAEWTALSEQCTWTWTNREGVLGFTVTAVNGNSIFIPAAGYRMDDVIREVGDSSNYWSSTADTEYPVYAWYMFTKKDRYVGEYRSGRYYGHSVRPVAEI